MGSKYGAEIKAMWSDPSGPKLIKELDRGGCCFPPTYCKAPPVAKKGIARSYLHIYEDSIQENLYAPKVIFGCCAIPCGQGQDNVTKQYFDHKPFYPSPNQTFATDEDMNFCCYVPFAFDGIDGTPFYNIVTKPCIGGTVSIVAARPKFCSCMDDETFYKFATRQPVPCIPCAGPVCCTRPLAIFLKDSATAKAALNEAVGPALTRKKEALKSAPSSAKMERGAKV